ncbi:MAG: hypothetical protein MUC40_07195 [Akkermansiaceae bacterium]|jgi:hypothetical protein|nr:hypothetical protein [Akkermansiaceae bacterium]
MKLSIILSAIILIVAAAFGWQGSRQLSVVRATHHKLVEEAAALGISTGTGESGNHRVRSKRQARPDKTAEAKSVAAEFIALTREMEEIEKRGKKPDAAAKKRIVDFMDRILSLDASQMKILIAEFRDASDLKDETRHGLLIFSIMTLSSDHPQAALGLFTESPELLGGNGMIAKYLMANMMASALANWAKDDPLGALEWIRANKETHPDLVTDDAMNHLLKGVASKDPVLAFQFLGELEESKRAMGVNDIIRAANGPEQRTATLAALRDYASSFGDNIHKNATLTQALNDLVFGDDLQSAGFEATTSWIESANLTKEELVYATQHMQNGVKTSETGQWIEWLANSGIPENAAKHRAYGLTEQWTEKDYQAAGKWLASAPDSPEKQAAVSAYAAKVHPYEPEIAMQWLQTLPPGPDRSKALEAMHRAMPRKTDAEKAAAKAFAREQGLRD